MIANVEAGVRGRWMTRISALAAAFLLVSAMRAGAADQPLYAPAPDWVIQPPIPTAPAPKDASSAQILLSTTQSRYSPEHDQTYSESAVRITSAQGLSQLGNLIEAWNPASETLTVHRVQVIRDGKSIDLLAGGKRFTVLRRETNLDSAMLDGELTATLQPEGLQVGDILDVAFSTSRHEPAFGGRSEGGAELAHLGEADRIYVRELWSDARPMRWSKTSDLGQPSLTNAHGWTELSYDLHDNVTPPPPTGAPLRFLIRGLLQVSQFNGWADVSAVATPLYAKASTLQPGSPLQAEVARIKALSPDSKIRAMAALRLVQDDVRYVLLGMGAGGYTPAAADLTWTRRFGDCKGKTALLLALLHGLGIEAQPALVNTVLGDGLDERLPVMEAFDHVLVRAVIDGRVYWLDGTRVGDRKLDDIDLPDFHWALPVQPSGATLVALVPPPPKRPLSETAMRLDLSAGMDKPAPAHLETTLRGDAAVGMKLAFDQIGGVQSEQVQRQYWARDYPWIKPDKVAFTYDDENRVARLALDGVAAVPWSTGPGVRDFALDASSLAWEASFKREPGPDQNAPFAVGYPAFQQAEITILLPDKGAGFLIVNGDDINEQVAGVDYSRISRINAGVMRHGGLQRKPGFGVPGLTGGASPEHADRP